MSRVSIARLLTLFVIAAAACDGSMEAKSSQNVEDKILPELHHERRIGGMEALEDTALLMPNDVVIRDGHLYVSDDAEPDVRLIDDSGGLVRTFGTEGAGPGELRSISGFAVTEDREVLVADGRNTRMVLFGPEGDMKSEFRLDGRISGIEMDGSGRIHVDRSGPATEDSTAGAPTSSVLSATAGDELFTHGSYDPLPDRIADIMNNDARYAAGKDGTMWALYLYRGRVEQTDSLGNLIREFRVPSPKGRPGGGPFVEWDDPDERMSFTIVRATVANDIATDETGRVYILVKQSPDEDNAQRYTEVFVYDPADDTPSGSWRLRENTERFAVAEGRMYARCDHDCTAPTIDVYRIEE